MADPGDVLVERVAGTPEREWFYRSGRESVRGITRDRRARRGERRPNRLVEP